MSNSYPLVSFGLDDTNIKDKISSITRVEGTPPLSNFSDLQSGIVTVVPYATFEPDFWVLDGNYKFMPVSRTHNGFWGASLSDGNGNVGTGTNSSNFIVNFSSDQSIDSFTMHFDKASNNWCTTVRVVFLDVANNVLYDTTVHPTGVDYTITHSVSNFRNIHIYLQATNNPYRFPRMKGFDFNTVTYLDSTKIKSAKITEEFSPISATLTSNSFDLDLLLDSSDFSITNPASPYANLADRMPFRVYEVIDGVTSFMGQFYLDTWDNVSEREVTFSCLDAISLLAKMPFYGWGNAPGKIPDIFASIFAGTGIAYSLDPWIISHAETYGTTTYEINGVLEPGMTIRDVIQKIAFACRFSITCSKSYKIVVTPTPAAFLPAYLGVGDENYDIQLYQEKIEQVKLLPKIDAVKISSNWDNELGTGQVIYSQALGIGSHIINLNGGWGNIVLSNAPSSPSVPWIKWSPAGNGWMGDPSAGEAFYAFVTLTAADTVVLWGAVSMGKNPYSNNVSIVGTVSATSKTVEIDSSIYITYGMTEQQMSFDAQAQWVYDYYSARYYQKSKVYGIECHAGDLVYIDSLDGKHILGIIEKAAIELTGFRTVIEVTGTLQ